MRMIEFLSTSYLVNVNKLYNLHCSTSNDTNTYRPSLIVYEIYTPRGSRIPVSSVNWRCPVGNGDSNLSYNFNLLILIRRAFPCDTK